MSDPARVDRHRVYVVARAMCGARGGAECTHAVTKVMRADSVPTDDPVRSTAEGSVQDSLRLNHTTNREQRQLWKPHGVGARAPHTHAAPSQPQGDSEHSHACDSLGRRLPRAGGWGHLAVMRRLPRAVGLPPATCRKGGGRRRPRASNAWGAPPATCQQRITPPATCSRPTACHVQEGGGRHRPRASNA